MCTSVCVHVYRWLWWASRKWDDKSLWVHQANIVLWSGTHDSYFGQSALDAWCCHTNNSTQVCHCVFIAIYTGVCCCVVCILICTCVHTCVLWYTLVYCLCLVMFIAFLLCSLVYSILCWHTIPVWQISCTASNCLPKGSGQLIPYIKWWEQTVLHTSSGPPVGTSQAVFAEVWWALLWLSTSWHTNSKFLFVYPYAVVHTYMWLSLCIAIDTLPNTWAWTLKSGKQVQLSQILPVWIQTSRQTWGKTWICFLM